MSIYETPIASLDGKNPKLLGPVAGKAALFVNVASKCGLTPQYEGLQALHAELDDAGFTVVGFPCNQFLEQEPGTADDIAEFCSVNYGVTFRSRRRSRSTATVATRSTTSSPESPTARAMTATSAGTSRSS